MVKNVGWRARHPAKGSNYSRYSGPGKTGIEYVNAHTGQVSRYIGNREIRTPVIEKKYRHFYGSDKRYRAKKR